MAVVHTVFLNYLLKLVQTNSSVKLNSLSSPDIEDLENLFIVKMRQGPQCGWDKNTEKVFRGL